MCNETINDRLDWLRSQMVLYGYQAVVIPHCDPHQSEYPAAHWLVREFFSGFDGSAGTLVVGLDNAWLMTDSRYWLQAAQQLEGTGIELVKTGLPDSLSLGRLVGLTAGQPKVAVDPEVYSSKGFKELKDELTRNGGSLDTWNIPVGEIWSDRPELPLCEVIALPDTLTGKSAKEKVSNLSHALKTDSLDGILIGDLAEISWLLNIRSHDVPCNPVVTSYLYISEGINVLFVDERKLTAEVNMHLAAAGVKTAPYAAVHQFLKLLPKDAVIAIDPDRISYGIEQSLGTRAKHRGSMVQLDKAIKNETELQGMRRAHLEDGVALVKGFMEIERRMAQGDKLTEVDVDLILTAARADRPGNDGLSFETIAGYGPNGAIVHYTATEETAATLLPHGLLLVDSGAQFPYGTTDITRTVSLGAPTDEERADYTAVLRGTVDLAAAVFPVGTRGAQLDVLARQWLWRKKLNYLHGTGHGVGCYLNVHEGPHSIRMQENPQPLLPGMVVSDEPGVYLEGKYGIRLENLLAAQDAGDGFMSFEVLTLYPFEAQLTDFAALTQEERRWLADYHRTVEDRLSPMLNADERAWLHAKCAPYYE